MFELPAEFVTKAQEFADSGREPSQPRAAATVILLRDSAAGLEVYLVRRVQTMAFAPGMYVFPGGAVDAADLEPDRKPGWAQRLGLKGPKVAGAVVTAALRETEEEAGVALTEDSLHPWARWITPAFEPMRFDTFFFASALPPGLAPRHIPGEADHADWMLVTDAVARHRDGGLPMLPPTIITLSELAEHKHVADVLAADRDLTPILPGL